MAKKVVIEVEVPEWVSSLEAEEAIRSAARRALLYLILEKAQKGEPTEKELKRLAREAKASLYRRIVEED